MSFKNKMKNRGISKLDNLTETPDYITPPTPKKVSWNWLKIAIPVTAGLALIIIPVSILGATGAFNARNANKGGAPRSDNSASYDPEYNWDPAPSDASPSSGDESYNGDTSFEALLTRNHVNENCVIEVYDYADGYMEPTYTFIGEEATNIINSLKTISSDISAYNTKRNSSSVNLNSSKYLMGINHRLRFKDDTNSFMGMYYSQFSTLVIEDSAFNLTGSEAYTLMDAHVEMDYDPTFDETIN